MPQEPFQDCRRPFVAYLADPLAVGGAAPLLRQKRSVERLAVALGGHVSRWGIDSGRRFAGQRVGDAVLALLADLSRGDTLLVEDVAVLGVDREAVEVVAGTMAMLGIAVLSAHDLGVADEVRVESEFAALAWRRAAERRPAPTARRVGTIDATLGLAS